MSAVAGRRHSARAAPALRALAEEDPAIAALSLWCRHRDGAVTRTMGETITYGPDFEGLAFHEQKGLAAHHVLHVALRHPARLAALETRMGGACDADLFNLVADALVNEALLQADHALPRPAVRLTELLARSLPGEEGSEAALADWDVERLYFALHRAGSSEGGGHEAAEDYAAMQAFESDLGAADEAEDGEGEAAEAARWRQHLARALDAGRQAGRGIGRIGHRLADVPEPRVPWEILLRRLLAQATMMAPRPSPLRPSRRWLAASAEAARRGTPVPGFHPGQRPLTEVPKIAIGLDASSSIDDARLRLFWAEMSGIARRARAALNLMVFDDAIRYRARLDPAETRFALPELPRGGGTAFEPVIAEAVQAGVSALVMLTDLEGEAGAPPKGFPVIWVVPDAGALVPPFGRLVDMGG